MSSGNSLSQWRLQESCEQLHSLLVTKVSFWASLPALALRSAFLQSWFLAADQPFPVADLFMVKVICQSKCVLTQGAPEAAFGPSWAVWEERRGVCVPLQAWGEALLPFDFS